MLFGLTDADLRNDSSENIHFRTINAYFQHSEMSGYMKMKYFLF